MPRGANRYRRAYLFECNSEAIFYGRQSKGNKKPDLEAALTKKGVQLERCKHSISVNYNIDSPVFTVGKLTAMTFMSGLSSGHAIGESMLIKLFESC